MTDKPIPPAIERVLPIRVSTNIFKSVLAELPPNARVLTHEDTAELLRDQIKWESVENDTE